MNEETYVDENTLVKVYDALQQAGLNIAQASDAVNEMQQAGILFRERMPALPYFTKDIKVTREDLGMVNPEASPILRYFNYLHLPEHLQDISKMFCTLAEDLENLLPPGPEKSVALRKLLEAKDAAVRSRL
jgi:hypothetical protein